MVSIIIELSRRAPSDSLLRLYALNLLVNMSVLEYLHGEYLAQIYELSTLVELTLKNDNEALSTFKILVNLSANKENLECLLKMTNLDIKTIVDSCTLSKKTNK